MAKLVQLKTVIGRSWLAGDVCEVAGALYYCDAPTSVLPPSANWTEIGGAAWGDITGTLSAQSDLQTALNAKASTTHAASHQNNGSDEISVAGLSGLLADGQTPLAHAVSHKSGGTDAIMLDELGTPTDVTLLNATTTYHGLLRKLDGLTTTFMRGDGTWAAPAGGGITQLTGDVTAGPGSGSQTATIPPDTVTNAMLADAAANSIKGNNTGGAANPLDLTAAQVTAMLAVFTSVLQGLVPASGGGSANYLRADGIWTAPTAGAADTNPNLYVTTADYNLTANRSLYFAAEYEIGETFVTDLAATAILEIG